MATRALMWLRPNERVRGQKGDEKQQLKERAEDTEEVNRR